jgi:hypothetical protein
MRSKSTPRLIAQRARTAKMVEMRVAGASVTEIGKAFGVTPQAASQAILGELDRWVREPTEAIRQLEVARIDQIIAAHLPRAIDKADPDTKRADVVERYMARRARLLGLDAPTKVETKAEVDITTDDDQLTGKLAALIAAGAKGGGAGATEPAGAPPA